MNGLCEGDPAAMADVDPATMISRLRPLDPLPREVGRQFEARDHHGIVRLGDLERVADMILVSMRQRYVRTCDLGRPDLGRGITRQEWIHRHGDVVI